MPHSPVSPFRGFCWHPVCLLIVAFRVRQPFRVTQNLVATCLNAASGPELWSSPGLLAQGSRDLLAQHCGLIPLNLWSLAESSGLLAQDPAAQPQPSFLSPLTLVAGFFFLFYFIVIAPERRKKAEEAKMMSALKKNDRVVTIGGIHGVVASISDGSDVVTLKVDEGGNTRIKVNRSAIGQVIDPSEDSSNDKKND